MAPRSNPDSASTTARRRVLSRLSRSVEAVETALAAVHLADDHPKLLSTLLHATQQTGVPTQQLELGPAKHLASWLEWLLRSVKRSS